MDVPGKRRKAEAEVDGGRRHDLTENGLLGEAGQGQAAWM